MIKPMLAEIADKAFNSSDYLWEVKLDGIRALVTVEPAADKPARVKIQARSGADKTGLFPELTFNVRCPVILDGEIVSYDARGKSQFNLVQHRANRTYNIADSAKQYPCVYEIFDILQVGRDGTTVSLMNQPLAKRKQMLDLVVTPTATAKIALTYSDGEALYQRAQDNHLEGIIGKKLSGLYYPDKREWLKVKVPQMGSYWVGGFTAGTGWRADTFGALVLFDADLKYVGMVGTGFNDQQIGEIMAGLNARKMATPGFSDADIRTIEREARTAVTYVRPELKILVKYLEMTNDGRLRFPAFKGMVT